MAITEMEVKKVAKLARLGLPDTALAPYVDKLSSILDMVEQLSEIDTTGVEPMAHPLGLEQVQRLRADIVTEQNHREQYQAMAPETEKGLYLVPKVIE